MNNDIMSNWYNYSNSTNIVNMLLECYINFGNDKMSNWYNCTQNINTIRNKVIYGVNEDG